MAMTAPLAGAPTAPAAAPKSSGKPMDAAAGENAGGAVAAESGEGGGKSAFSDMVDERGGDEAPSDGAPAQTQVPQPTAAPSAAPVETADLVLTPPELDAEAGVDAGGDARPAAQKDGAAARGGVPASAPVGPPAAANPMAAPDAAAAAAIVNKSARPAPASFVDHAEAASEVAAQARSANAQAGKMDGAAEGAAVLPQAARAAGARESADGDVDAVLTALRGKSDAKPSQASPIAAAAQAMAAEKGDGRANAQVMLTSGQTPGAASPSARAEAALAEAAAEEAPRPLAPRVEPLAAAQGAHALNANAETAKAAAQLATTVQIGGQSGAETFIDSLAEPVHAAPSSTTSGLHASAGDPRAAAALTSAHRDPGPVMAQIATAVRSSARDRVEVRLDPPELGRVTLHLHIRDDAVSAVVSADRSETADLLRRHGEELQRALKEGGFGDVSLDFSGGGEQREASAFAPEGAASDAPLPQMNAPSLRAALRGAADGLDIRV